MYCRGHWLNDTSLPWGALHFKFNVVCIVIASSVFIDDFFKFDFINNKLVGLILRIPLPRIPAVDKVFKLGRYCSHGDDRLVFLGCWTPVLFDDML